MVPTKCLEYLGNVIDSNTMTITLPERRQRKIVQSYKQLFNVFRAKIRDVAKVIGLLVAAIPAVEMGKLHYRRLETAKISALEKEKGNFDIWMGITHEMKADLICWLNHISKENRKIFWKGTEIDLYTDASNFGWGGSLNHHQVNGRWSLTEAKLHINAKELKDILLTISSFAQHIKGQHLRVFCDNTTACQ